MAHHSVRLQTVAIFLLNAHGCVITPAYQRAGTNHVNDQSYWVKVVVTVTRLVSFKVIGLHQVIKANDLTE